MQNLFSKKMSDNDLDNFFDEVEEVAKEAKKDAAEDKNLNNNVFVSDTNVIGSAKTSAEQNGGVEYRPAKKARVDDASQDSVDAVEVDMNNHSRASVVVSKKATSSVASKISAPPITNSTEDRIYQIVVPEECLKQTIPPPPPAPPANPHPPTYYQYNGQATQQDQGNRRGSSEKPALRIAAGKKWTDATLSEFPENDYRLFVGNLDKVITEKKLAESFQSKYPSFATCRIIYDKVSGTSKGYGFVSLMDPKDLARAIREMDQSWLGSRPIKVKRSDWKERDVREIRKGNRRKKGARGRR